MKKISLAALSLVVSASVYAGGTHSFESLDKDKNGKITASEFSKHKGMKFEAADADKNGEVTKEELDALHKAHHGDHKDHGKAEVPATTAPTATPTPTPATEAPAN